jgi:hypothetical protein
MAPPDTRICACCQRSPLPPRTPARPPQSSVLWHAHAVDPATAWLLQQYAVPVYGEAAVAAWQRLLRLALQVTWLLPVYVITILVSCIWWVAWALRAVAGMDVVRKGGRCCSACKTAADPLPPEAQSCAVNKAAACRRTRRIEAQHIVLMAASCWSAPGYDRARLDAHASCSRLQVSTNGGGGV